MREPLGPADPLPAAPRRILIAGCSGAGKSTLAAELSARLGLPYRELDALHHGPNWVPRPEFVADVTAFAATDAWISEWQYRAVRALLLDRAELLIWLDLSRWRVFSQLVPRTVRRRLRRVQLWNGNVEPPLWTVLTDRDHLLRWAWRTYPRTAERVGGRPGPAGGTGGRPACGAGVRSRPGWTGSERPTDRCRKLRAGTGQSVSDSAAVVLVPVSHDRQLVGVEPAALAHVEHDASEHFVPAGGEPAHRESEQRCRPAR